MLAEHVLLECGFDVSDLHLASTLMGLVKEDHALVQLALCILSRAARKGDVGVDLASPTFQDGMDLYFLSQMDLKNITKVVAASRLSSDGTDNTPVVVDKNGFCYFYRYWKAQEQLALRILSTSTPSTIECGDPVRNSIELAKASGFLAITGGPGTGKTTLVAKVLAELLAEQPQLSIVLCTPTGKAAIRLRTALLEAKQQGGVLTSYSEGITSKIPEEVSTIHKLLCPIGTTGGFRFNAENLLPIDVLVVDEASMIDLQLMGNLFDAVSNDAKIILIGDKHQLSSIQPGMVLGDICYGESNHFAKNDHVAKCIVTLEKSYRFGDKSEIGMLAAAVNRGNVETAYSILLNATNENVFYVDTDDPDAREKLLALAHTSYLAFGQEANPIDKLRKFNCVRVLCATNQGPLGVHALNEEISKRLLSNMVFFGDGMVTENQPIMMTQNDYAINLFNGDVGIVCQDDKSRGQVAFSTEEGTIRFVSSSMIHSYQSAFAISIHKSQGSEFNHTIVVLPETVSPVLSRELLYTAITRAKKKLTIFASQEVIAHCIRHPVERTTGLRDRLWKD